MFHTFGSHKEYSFTELAWDEEEVFITGNYRTVLRK